MVHGTTQHRLPRIRVSAKQLRYSYHSSRIINKNKNTNVKQKQKQLLSVGDADDEVLKMYKIIK